MVAAHEGNVEELSEIREGKLEVVNELSNRLISITVPVDAQESRRCRGCLQNLSTGHFDHDGEEGLLATCRICLIGDLL